MATLYLNKVGDKWVETNSKGQRQMEFCLVDHDGKQVLRKADYFYAFGNFWGLSFRVKGKRINALPENYKTDLGDHKNLYVVRLAKWDKQERS